MLRFVYICLFLLTSVLLSPAYGQEKDRTLNFDFYEGIFHANVDRQLLIKVDEPLTPRAIKWFYSTLNDASYKPIVDSLIAYKQQHRLNDWLYYQLIRKVAQLLSPKEDNYSRYTLYKWFLLTKTGYDARLALTSNKVIFYVLNTEEVEDIPFFNVDDKKYVCINFHDYPNTDLNQDPPVPVKVSIPGAVNAFSFKIDRMPDFKAEDYTDKALQFTYEHKAYYFNIKLNPSVAAIFKNYPVVDFESYFNIPLSKETYGSLIPMLKNNVKEMDQKKGIDYLMRFTRYAFLYESDEENFGKEKRLSPEETLFAKYSDCDDRVALFFYLVKEIYNLPMIAVLYPTHITAAVQFDKPVGSPLMYKGKAYSFCEPTPQADDLEIGEISAKLRNVPYQVVYQYTPGSEH
jgi:hypothetical protein